MRIYEKCRAIRGLLSFNQPDNVIRVFNGVTVNTAPPNIGLSQEAAAVEKKTDDRRHHVYVLYIRSVSVSSNTWVSAPTDVYFFGSWLGNILESIDKNL